MADDPFDLPGQTQEADVSRLARMPLRTSPYRRRREDKPSERYPAVGSASASQTGTWSLPTRP